MLTLGIDTSNYATSAAIFDGDKNELVADVKMFLPVKDGQLGLRQSDAVFHHTRQLPLVLEELSKTGLLQKVERVGVSVKPRAEEGSYMPCFLTGESAAVFFAAAKGLPVVRTTHQQGHVAAAFLGSGQLALAAQPSLVFHASGGTSDLLLVNGYDDIKHIGGSADLYAGQAVDRLAGLFGFSFPGGEELSKLALECSERITVHPSVKGMQCSFSGLENQCAKLLNDGRERAYVAKYCLVYIAVSVCEMAKAARAQFGELPLVLAGGVMSSTTVSAVITGSLKNSFFAPPKFSSDNAIGNALIAAKGV